MMKQKLLFIFALLCAVAQGVKAQPRVFNLSELTSTEGTMVLVANDGDELTGSIRIDKNHQIKAQGRFSVDSPHSSPPA